MQRIQFFLAVAGVAAGCGGASHTDGVGTAGTSGSGGDAPTDLTPAPNIDVNTCAAIHGSDTDPSSANSCATCCKAQPSNVASSFTYENQCTCAAPRDGDESKTICASATADGTACSACCGQHDYLSSGWVGADATTTAQCGCGLLKESTVCASFAQSESTCQSCCLHQGFIGTGFGFGGCDCIGP